MDMDANTRNWIIGGVVLVIVLIGAWWLFTKPSSGTGTNATSTGTTTEDTGTTGTTGSTSSTSGTGTMTTSLQDESVQADDQPAGDSVVIAKMNLTRSTWVAVRDTRSILGARRFEAGATDGIVNLLRNTAAGEQYTVLMYVDDGDKAFDFHTDMMITNQTGAAVGDMFTATNGD